MKNMLEKLKYIEKIYQSMGGDPGPVININYLANNI